ncbi:MAG: glycosyltransferase family 2 protein [Candidatus Uhrbacteria bacterium]
MKPTVAIIYLAYNTSAYLERVFLSVEQLDYPKESLHLIVVDNASSDGSADWIRENVVPKSEKELPRVTFFPSATNTGFAGGNNLGIDRALLEGTDYVYLLNGDAKLDPAAITEAVATAETDRTIGAVQSLVRLWQDEGVLNATGGSVHFLGFGFARDNGRRASAEDVASLDGTDVAYASGAAVLYRSSVLREVGLLEDFYFMYHDDLELGWRIRLAGYRNVLATRSVAYHHYEFRRSIKKLYWMERARLLVFFSHLRPATLVVLSPLLVVLELALLAFAAKGGWLRDKLCVYLDLLRPTTWKHIVEKRKFSNLIRKVSDKEIVRLWTGKIEHQETSNPVVDNFANPILSAVWFVLKRLV